MSQDLRCGPLVAGLAGVAEGAVLAQAPTVAVAVAGDGGGTRTVEFSAYRLTLDMRRGMLFADCRLDVGPELEIEVRTLRLVSMRERALGVQLIEFRTIRGLAAEITLQASFGGLDLGLSCVRLEQDVGLWRAKTSGKGLAMAAAASLQVDGDEAAGTSFGPFRSSWSWRAAPGKVASFERLVGFARSDDVDADPRSEALATLGRAKRGGSRRIVAEHEEAWAERWRCSDVEVDADGGEQRALRFAIHHLNAAADPRDERVSVGARALTGDDYRGHVFWDTEVYLLPFYTMTWPEAARAMLMYRFHTLGAAKAKAATLGWRGALYAWESADTGAETTPEHAVGPDRKVVEILCGTQEQHISADVAYAVWRYWQATGDDGFFRDAGAEIVLETGRFWASRAGLEKDGRRHVRGVIGPDEYHEHVDDNAFTNVMARWNIRRAVETAETMRKRWPDRWTDLARTSGIDDAEIARWSRAAEEMVTGFDPGTGLYEQFDGFFDLEHVDLADYAGRCVPMDVVLGRERTARSDVVKQADVVALLGLLPEEFPQDAGPANFRHYEPLCSHGSSLSRAMHGLVAARLGLAEKALAYFHQTSAIDLGDDHVAIAGGLHIAALGGVWQIAVLGFAGLTLRPNGLGVDPRLPPTWRSLRFPVRWQGREVTFRVDGSDGSVEAILVSGDPMTISVRGDPQRLDRGRSTSVAAWLGDAVDRGLNHMVA